MLRVGRGEAVAGALGRDQLAKLGYFAAQLLNFLTAARDCRVSAHSLASRYRRSKCSSRASIESSLAMTRS